MIARLLRCTAAAAMVVAVALPAAAAPAPAPAPPPAPAPAYPTPNTDGCPYRDSPPPAVDSSEVPAPGSPTPSPLPVPDTPPGGEALGGCGPVLPAGAPPVPYGIDSAGWLIADLTAGEVIAAKDPHGRYRPASTIKLLLAQVALRDLDLDRVIEGTMADFETEGDRAGVAPGGRYTVRSLLEGLLLVSGNDAANALARALGGTEAAVAKMNERAAELGAHDTRAATPSGLDGPGMSTSAYDLALILRGALADPRFLEIATLERAVFPGHPPLPTAHAPPAVATAPPGGEIPPGGEGAAATAAPAPPPTSQPPYPLLNENLLLKRVPGAVAGKTGYTDDAKKTYVGAVDRGGHRYVVVQLFGLSRAGNSYWDQFQRLLDYGVALRGHSIGALGDAPTGEDTLGDAPTGEGTLGTPAAAAAGGGASAHEAGDSGMSTGMRVAVGAGGLLIVGALLVAAVRTGRSQR